MKTTKGYAKLSGAATPQIGCKEYLVAVSSRIYFSSFYRLVYFFMIASSIVCVVWTGTNGWKIPSSIVFISLEIVVSALLVFEILLRMMAFKKRFWHKWCNIFDVMALVMSLVSLVIYFNEESVLGELEEVAADSVMALRNAVQNRSDQPTTIGKDIDFEKLDANSDDTRELIMDAEIGMCLDCDEDEEIQTI
ncbi:hypothetical protein PsorP6_004036 [Peronosclerospora sorghi]|uniref:Uncharacterized protein n=1 Tax=Peronosclerospora sorghi TaxID=230839 RepID=A0ACC0VKH4_9STRA|nr:hypothetical protein PsorP6_004036 [Peronosclerospora sorghi]